MDFPLWKRALSHFIPLILRSFSSPENGEMELSLNRGELCLTTKNAVYSFGKHYTSFSNAFARLGIGMRRDIRRVLVLGWGMGSIGELLRAQEGLAEMTAVEHDALLVDVYHQMTDEPLPFRLNLVCADAIEWVGGETGSYDLICSDVFTDNKTPKGIVDHAYLDYLTRLLAPGGMILLSKLHLNAEDAGENRLLESLLESRGYEFQLLHSTGNSVYCWEKPVGGAR